MSNFKKMKVQLYIFQVLRALLIDKSFKPSASYRMLKLSYRLCLDLSDSLSCHLENPADLFKCIGISVAKAVS